MESKKPVCRYGATCYRKNPEHLKQFAHPGRREPKASESSLPMTDEANSAKKDAPHIKRKHVHIKLRLLLMSLFLHCPLWDLGSMKRYLW